MEKVSFEDSGKVLRILDSIENIPLAAWINVSGTIPKSIITPEEAYKNIANQYKQLLQEFPTLRLKIITINNKYYYKYAEDSEIQMNNLIKIVEGITPLQDGLSEWFEIDKAPLWRLELSETENENTKIRLKICHGIIDGRGAFDVLDLFYCYALNKPLTERLNNYRNQPAIYDFGKACWYKEEITKMGFVEPKINFIALQAELNPPITRPSHVVHPQWEVPYAPISKFCRKYNVTAQAIVMAIQNKALRAYHKGKYDNIPLIIFSPVDNRKYQYATDLFKKSLFFYHIGNLYPMVDKKDDILENILHCSEKFKEAYNSMDACISGYSLSIMTDEKGNQINQFTKPLDPCKNNYTFASHLGLVGENLDHLNFSNQIAVYDTFYYFNFYGFHNKVTFYFSINAPYNCPEEFFKIFKDTSMKFYDYIVKDVSDKNK